MRDIVKKKNISMLWGYLWKLAFVASFLQVGFFDGKHPTKAVEMREMGANNSNCMLKIRIRYYYKIQSNIK